MTGDLYQTLGVTPSATPEQVKAAHRQAAKRTHPDAGGRREDFLAVQLAYEVLRDPRRRARYDETGQAEEPRPDKVLEALSRVFADLAGTIGSHRDLVGVAHEAIAVEVRRHAKAAREAREKAKVVRQAAARLGGKDPEKLGKLGEAMKRRAAECVAVAQAAETDEAFGRVLLEALDGLSYRHDAQAEIVTKWGAPSSMSDMIESMLKGMR